MTRIVTGLFEGRRTVDLVVEHLIQEFEVPRERVQVHAADPESGEEARSPQDDDQDVALPQLGLTEEVARAYGEGMRRGGILLAAWVDDDHADRALATYREYGAAEPAVCETETRAAPDVLEQRIRIRAYHLWEEAGRPEGRDLEFWYQARAAEGEMAVWVPQEFAGETGAAPLPERDRSPGA